MTSAPSLRERLRASLARTRDKLGFGATGPSGTQDWDAIEEALILADVGVAATSTILARARASGDASALRDELLAVLERSASRVRAAAGSPHVTMIVGVNGVGKTTTVGKLGRRIVGQGKSVVVIAADTFRAAAQEQLATWSERAGAFLVAGEPGRDPASVVHDGLTAAVARGADAVLIDTAGRLHTKRPLMDELKKVERIAGRIVASAPHDCLLVMDATVGSNGFAQAKQFEATLGLTGVVLTKMDGTAKGGIVVAVARELGLPVRFIGVGEGVGDLLPFDPEAFVDAILS